MAWKSTVVESPTHDRLNPGVRLIPEGYREIRVRLLIGGEFRELKALFNGHQVVVGEQDGFSLPVNDEAHNCDQMGCGWEHVMFRLWIDE